MCYYGNMRFMVVATSGEMCTSDAIISSALETAMNASVIAPVNGGGHWLSSESRITRNASSRALSCAGGPEGTVTIARVYETSIPNDPQLIRAFEGILGDRVAANLVNHGNFNVVVTPFNEYTHGQASFWQGPHAQTRTRDHFGNSLSDSENPISPTNQSNRPNNLTQEIADAGRRIGEGVGSGVGRGIEASGFSPWMIVGLVGLVAIIAAAPSINTSVKAFMEARRVQREALKLKKNPKRKKISK